MFFTIRFGSPNIPKCWGDYASFVRIILNVKYPFARQIHCPPNLAGLPKIMKNRRLSSLLLGSSLIVCTASAHAADVIKANNTTALNVAGSWVTAVPSSSDVALWNNTVTATNAPALGGNVSWQGIRIANPGGGLVTINGSAGATLTLGSAGIDMSAACLARSGR
jgi:hypothetical protein